MHVMVMTTPYTHKLKFKGQSVQNTELKQTDGQTDATGCFFIFSANAVGNSGLRISGELLSTSVANMNSKHVLSSRPHAVYVQHAVRSYADLGLHTHEE